MSDRDADFLFDEETEGDADGEVEGGEEVIVCRACGESEREGGVLLDSSLATAEEEENVWEKETDVGLKDEEFHLPLLGVFSAAVSLFFVASVEHAIVDSRRKVVSIFSEQMAFCSSTCHLSELVAEFKKKLPVWTPRQMLFEDYLLISIKEKPLDVVTILDLIHVKHLLDLTEDDSARAFVQGLKILKDIRHLLPRFRFVADRVVKPSSHHILAPLRACSQKNYFQIEQGLIDVCIVSSRAKGLYGKEVCDRLVVEPSIQMKRFRKRQPLENSCGKLN